jgi:hypothetical protein
VLYASRPPEADGLEEEIAREWKEVVEAQLTPGTVERGKDRRLACGAVARRRSAKMQGKDGNDGFIALFVVAPYGRIASVAVVAKSAVAFASLESGVLGVLDSLRLDVATVAAGAGEPGGNAADLAGAWASSSGGTSMPDGVVHLGSSRQQYDLRKDGTYAFRRESWGGSYRSDEWYVVEEKGTWSADGAMLTVKPASATGAVKDGEGNVRKRADPPLATVVYLWKLHFFEGIDDRQLVLTPPGETDRDGLFASNSQFKASYLMSRKYSPEWRFPPK